MGGDYRLTSDCFDTEVRAAHIVKKNHTTQLTVYSVSASGFLTNGSAAIH